MINIVLEILIYSIAIVGAADIWQYARESFLWIDRRTDFRPLNCRYCFSFWLSVIFAIIVFSFSYIWFVLLIVPISFLFTRVYFHYID